jgi:hypothetical protein
MPFTVALESTLAADWRKVCRVIVKGLKTAVDNATTEGANEARTTHQYKDRTGDLTRSIQARMWGGEDALGAEGFIEALMPYASFVENGHAIVGRHSRKFASTKGAKATWHFSKRARPFPFMAQAYLKAERVLERDVLVAIDSAQSALPP